MKWTLLPFMALVFLNLSGQTKVYQNLNGFSDLHQSYMAEPTSKQLNLDKMFIDMSPTILVPIGSLAQNSNISPFLQFSLGYKPGRVCEWTFETGASKIRSKSEGSYIWYLPYLLGNHLYFSPKVHLDLAAGAHYEIGLSGPTAFFKNGRDFRLIRATIRAGMGYRPNPNIDLAVRYDRSTFTSFLCIMANWRIANPQPSIK